jgi:hypothetical protein
VALAEQANAPKASPEVARISGVSDAFASALWGLGFLFDVAEHGGAGINFHGGFTPGNYSPICYLKKEEQDPALRIDYKDQFELD